MIYIERIVTANITLFILLNSPRVLRQALRALPHSPRKRARFSVVVGEALPGCLFTPKLATRNRGTSALSEATRQQVLSFYEEDEISMMSPGQRDFYDDGETRMHMVRVLSLLV